MRFSTLPPHLRIKKATPSLFEIKGSLKSSFAASCKGDDRVLPKGPFASSFPLCFFLVCAYLKKGKVARMSFLTVGSLKPNSSGDARETIMVLIKGEFTSFKFFFMGAVYKSRSLEFSQHF